MYRVLIVEDEIILRKGLMLTVPWQNYQCEVIEAAKNGQEGLELALKHRPDIIISDIKMPLLTGIEMIEEIEKHYQPAVIFITAFNEFEYARKAVSLSSVEYLLKPFDDEQFDSALKKRWRKLKT